MDPKAQRIGLLYEQLIKRAHGLQTSSIELGADRRIYDQLYYIERGFDLRNIGYYNQLDIVRGHIATAIKKILKRELTKDEKINLRLLLIRLKVATVERDIHLIIEQALSLSERFR